MDSDEFSSVTGASREAVYRYPDPKTPKSAWSLSNQSAFSSILILRQFSPPSSPFCQGPQRLLHNGFHLKQDAEAIPIRALSQGRQSSLTTLSPH
jgi:hypothetical protein